MTSGITFINIYITCWVFFPNFCPQIGSYKWRSNKGMSSFTIFNHTWVDGYTMFSFFSTFIKLCLCIAHSFPFLLNNTYNKPIFSPSFQFMNNVHFCYTIILFLCVFGTYFCSSCDNIFFMLHSTLCMFICFSWNHFFGTIFYSSNHSS
jgi:hypothetical protein